MKLYDTRMHDKPLAMWSIDHELREIQVHKVFDSKLAIGYEYYYNDIIGVGYGQKSFHFSHDEKYSLSKLSNIVYNNEILMPIGHGAIQNLTRFRNTTMLVSPSKAYSDLRYKRALTGLGTFITNEKMTLIQMSEYGDVFGQDYKVSLQEPDTKLYKRGFFNDKEVRSYFMNDACWSKEQDVLVYGGAMKDSFLQEFTERDVSRLAKGMFDSQI
jgi:hypothetical protein